MLKVSRVLNILFGAFDAVLFLVLFGLGLGLIINADFIASQIAYRYTTEAVQLVGRTYFASSFVFLFMVGFSIIYNQKIKTATSKDQLMPWSIAMIIFGYVVVGLIALLADDKEFEGSKNKVQTTSSPTINSEDVTSQLQKLKSLYDQGLIDEDDYKTKKKEILDKM